MPADRFFDSNVLVYAFASGDPRSAVAEVALAEGGVLGVQPLNELTNVLRRKLGRSWEDIQQIVDVLEALLGAPRPLTGAVHRHAVELARRHTLSFYDALIIAAAQDAGCTTLLSEDLQHGSRYGSLQVVNPFR